jgi:hypothetical protein
MGACKAIASSFASGMAAAIMGSSVGTFDVAFAARIAAVIASPVAVAGSELAATVELLQVFGLLIVFEPLAIALSVEAAQLYFLVPKFYSGSITKYLPQVEQSIFATIILLQVVSRYQPTLNLQQQQVMQ